jgi:CDP-diglyceride synthetase
LHNGIYMDIAAALLMLVAANAAPWAAGRVLRDRYDAPIDFGWTLPDGRRVLGSHKTWRGLAAGAAASTVMAVLLGLDAWVGAGFGLLALLGDAVSSAFKRRLRFPPGKEVPVIDQLPESLLPLWAFARPLGLDMLEMLSAIVLFALLDITTARLRR